MFMAYKNTQMLNRIDSCLNKLTMMLTLNFYFMSSIKCVYILISYIGAEAVNIDNAHVILDDTTNVTIMRKFDLFIM